MSAVLRGRAGCRSSPARLLRSPARCIRIRSMRNIAAGGIPTTPPILVRWSELAESSTSMRNHRRSSLSFDRRQLLKGGVALGALTAIPAAEALPDTTESDDRQYWVQI